MNDRLRELDLISRMVTGKSLMDIANDVLTNKPESEMIREVSEHVRREHEKSDTLKNAVEELRAEDKRGVRA